MAIATIASMASIPVFPEVAFAVSVERARLAIVLIEPILAFLDSAVQKSGNIAQRLKNKADRMAVKGNSWQNLYPKELRAYQDWWAKVQAA